MDQIGGKNDGRLERLLSSAVNAPAADEVVLAMWQALQQCSDTAEARNKPEVFGALFHLAPRVSAEERLAMRRDFLEYFRNTPLPINQWPNEAMSYTRKAPYRQRVGLGEGIPWEHDPLSAALSWSSDVGTQTDLTPEYGVAETSTGVFSYLAQAMVSFYDEGLAGMWLLQYPLNQPVPITAWKRQPLQPPFEPTPWQQARELHLRRPDLHFPDHAWPRPGRKDS